MSIRRKLILAAAPFLLVLLAVATALVIEHVRGRLQLRSKTRDLQARGEHLDLERLRPPPPPPSSNGFDRLVSSATRLAGSADLLPHSLRLANPGRGIPAPRLDSWAGPSDSEITWSQIEAWVVAHANDLQDLQAALEEPFCRPHPDLSAGSRTPLPHLGKLKSAATSLSLLAAYHTRAGHSDAALAALRSLLRLESVLAHEPILISQIFRMALAAIAFNRTWDVLHARPWNNHELHQFQAALPSTSFAQSMIQGISGERALFLLSLNQLSLRELRDMMDGEVFTASEDPSVSTDAVRRLWRTAGGLGNARERIFRFAYDNQAKAAYLETMERILSAARDAAERQSRSNFDSLDLAPQLQRSSGRAALRTVYARIKTPELFQALDRSFAADTHRNLLATDIALQRFHAQRGHYPAALGELVPELLPEVPRDAMDGRPLRYRLEAGGTFTLWSAGNDRRDDGGDAAPWDRRPTYWWRAKDGVWPRPASEEETRAWIQQEALNRRVKH